MPTAPCPQCGKTMNQQPDGTWKCPSCGYTSKTPPMK